MVKVIKPILLMMIWSIWSITNATTPLFLPSDSFFSIDLTESTIKEWLSNSGDEFVFKYKVYGGETLCGSVGYYTLKFEGVTPSLRQALGAAIVEFPAFKRSQPGWQPQTNSSIVGYVYNKGFSGPLGLKLNENWISEARGRYPCWDRSKEGVVTNWRLGHKYRPLDLIRKLEKEYHLRQQFEFGIPDVTPSVDAKKIKFVLIGIGVPKTANLRNLNSAPFHYVEVFEGRYAKCIFDPVTKKVQRQFVETADD